MVIVIKETVLQFYKNGTGIGPDLSETVTVVSAVGNLNEDTRSCFLGGGYSQGVIMAF